MKLEYIRSIDGLSMECQEVHKMRCTGCHERKVVNGQITWKLSQSQVWMDELPGLAGRAGWLGELKIWYLRYDLSTNTATLWTEAGTEGGTVLLEKGQSTQNKDDITVSTTNGLVRYQFENSRIGNRRVAPMLELIKEYEDCLRQQRKRALDSTEFQSKKPKFTSCIHNPYVCSVYVE